MPGPADFGSATPGRRSDNGRHHAFSGLPPSRTLTSTRDRLRESLPLLLAGTAFWSGAWAASAYHVRLFSSPYPLWIVLALNGGVLAVAGTASVFLSKPDQPFGEDPDVVRVPRSQWEALTSGTPTILGSSEPPSVPPAVFGITEVVETIVPAEPQLPTVPAIELDTPLRTSDIAPSPLRRDVALLELRGIAEGAISIGQDLGVEELQTLLQASTEDLSRISRLLGALARLGESPADLLIRLLRLPPPDSAAVPAPGSETESERLAATLSSMIPQRDGPGGSPVAPRNSATAADEIDELLRELEPHTTPAKRAKRSTPPKDAKAG
jgi:hypothetical protein